MTDRQAGECLFCHPKAEEILDQNDLALTLVDTAPVTPGHCIVIPRRHAETYFELEREEVIAIDQLLRRARERLRAEDPAVTGFNIGTNAGKSAGQSVMHAHIHLLPRRDGDQENPRGGVRRIFPEKALY